MTIASYTDLRQQLKRFTRRTDIDDVFDTMIELVENDIYTGRNPLRVAEMVATEADACIIDDRTIDLRSGYLEMIRLVVDNTDLQFTDISDMPIEIYAGKPYRFTITSQILLDAIPKSTYAIEHLFFKRPAKLETTNSILSAYPNIYFYGLQAAIYDYAGEIDLSDVSRRRFNDEISGANQKFKQASFGPNPSMGGRYFNASIRWQPTRGNRNA